MANHTAARFSKRLNPLFIKNDGRLNATKRMCKNDDLEKDDEIVRAKILPVAELKTAKGCSIAFRHTQAFVLF